MADKLYSTMPSDIKEKVNALVDVVNGDSFSGTANDLSVVNGVATETATFSSTTASTVTVGATVSLPAAGVYKLSGAVYINNDGTTSTSATDNLMVEITDSTDTIASTYYTNQQMFGGNDDMGIVAPERIVTITAATDYNLLFECSVALTLDGGYAQISAVRLQ